MIQVPSYIVAFVLAFVMTGFALAVLKAIEVHGSKRWAVAGSEPCDKRVTEAEAKKRPSGPA